MYYVIKFRDTVVLFRLVCCRGRCGCSLPARKWCPWTRVAPMRRMMGHSQGAAVAASTAIGNIVSRRRRMHRSIGSRVLSISVRGFPQSIALSIAPHSFVHTVSPFSYSAPSFSAVGHTIHRHRSMVETSRDLCRCSLSHSLSRFSLPFHHIVIRILRTVRE